MLDSLWSTDEAKPDTYVLFRGILNLSADTTVELRTVGSAWYQGYLDGQNVLDGPLRYSLGRPEYQTDHFTLRAGRHVLAFHCHHLGVETRILQVTPPFLWCHAHHAADGTSLPIQWRCLPLDSQTPQVRRINPQLGWIEWRDTRREPVGWEQPGFDDSAWTAPLTDASPLPEPGPADLSPVPTIRHVMTPIAEGKLTTVFGYEPDEPSFIFHSRPRHGSQWPEKGLWRRYDVGQVRLGRPAITLDVPAGTVIEIAQCEALMDGRVNPYITFSDGPSCNLDRYIARGGEQTFVPVTPKGGRFVEVHVVNTLDARFAREEYLERTYHPPTEAAFTCGDSLLERIWTVGVETYRSCTEDALIDNPTRERGEWTGDVTAGGLGIGSVAYHDLRLCKRALQHMAQCAREDGLVAGLAPGGCGYLPTYAFQWAVTVMSYHRHTGDRALLEELWEPATRNLDAVEPFLNENGLHNLPGWNFVDWGYRQEDGPVDTACNLHYLWCLRAMGQWADVLGKDFSRRASEKQLTEILRTRLADKLGSGGWESVGYHCTVLAVCLGLLDDEAAAMAYLKRHLLSCFPNDPAAPRNDDPRAFNARLITPYFGHYVFPLFLDRGETDFVLDQYRTCWGWMLDQGLTTWPEVFDTRWSHSHQWAGCPTGQLSRYLLGLHPRRDLGPACFDFRFAPGKTLLGASGRLPHPAGGWVEVAWKCAADGAIQYGFKTDAPLTLRLPDGTTQEVNDVYETAL